MRRIDKGNGTFEVVKEIAPGVETHSHLEDVDGNVIIVPESEPELTDAALAMALIVSLTERLEAKGAI